MKRVDSAWISFQQSYASFSDFARDLEDFQVVDKKDDLPLFSFAEYPDVGVRRRKNNVLRVHAAMFDFDGVDLESMKPLLEVLRTTGYVLYTTFSHRGDLRNARFRIIAKLSRPVEGREWPVFWLKLVHLLGISTVVDHQCKDATHIYYPPAGPDRTKFHYEWADGPGLLVSEVFDSELPEKARRELPLEEDLTEVPEDSRAEITQDHVDLWSALLDRLEWEILTRPWDSPMRDLRNGQVWYLARQCPHIGDAAKLEARVKRAFDKRYDKHAHDPRSEEWRALAHKEIEVAIEDGLRYPWWPLKADNKQSQPLTFAGLANRVVEKYKREIRWLTDRQKWCTYNGRFWEPCGEEKILERVMTVVKELAEEVQVFFNEVFDYTELVERYETDPNVSNEEKVRASLHLKGLNESIGKIQKFKFKCENTSHGVTLSLVTACPEISMKFSDFDSKTNLLNFRNGTLNIETGQMHAHSPFDLLTQCINYDYDPAASCPTFERFMDEFTQGDEEKRRFLLRMTGYALLGRTTEQCFVLLLGDGQDGKSTFLKTMSAVLGATYAHKISANYLLEQNGGENHPTWLMSLHGKRYVWAEEPSHRRPFNESLVKDITGGSPITARKMREDESTFSPHFTLFMAANHKPSISGTDHGIWRRVRLVPCNARFTNPDKEMDKKLLVEANGILALLVREARAYLRYGCPVPEVVEVSGKEYEREEDPLEFFYERECVLESEPETHQGLLHPPPFRVERKTLWETYTKWLETRAATERLPRKKKAFLDVVTRRFGAPTKIEGFFYFCGLRPLLSEEKAKRQHLRGNTSSTMVH